MQKLTALNLIYHLKSRHLEQHEENEKDAAAKKESSSSQSQHTHCLEKAKISYYLSY